MPLQPVRAGIDVQVPEQAQVRPKGFWENAWLGARSGWNETTISLFHDINLLDEAKKEGPDVAYDDWNPDHPLYVPGVEWSSHLTYEILENMHESIALHRQMEHYKDTPWLDASAQLLGGLGGAMLDPINLIPFPLARFGSGILKRAMIVGAGNSLIELGLTPAIRKAYIARGQEYNTNDILTNMAFAAIAGGGLYGGFAGVAKAIRGMRHKGGPVSLSDDIVAKYKKEQPDFEIDIETRELIENNQLQAFDASPEHIRDGRQKINETIPGSPIYISVTGRIFDDITGHRNLPFVEVTAGKNELTLSSDRLSILKIAKDVLEVTQDTPKRKIRLIVSDSEIDTKLYTRSQLKKWIGVTEKSENVRRIKKDAMDLNLKKFILPDEKYEANLDHDFQWESRGGTAIFRIIPDAKKGIDISKNVGRIYRIFQDANGKETNRIEITGLNEKRKVLAQIKKSKPETNIDAPKRDTNENFSEEGPFIDRNNSEVSNSANKTVNKISKGTDEIDAQRTDDDIKYGGDPSQNIHQRAVQLEKVYSVGQLKEFGIEIKTDKDGRKTLDIKNKISPDPNRNNTPTRTTNLDNVRKQEIKKFNKLKEEEIKREAQKELDKCRKGIT